MVHDHNFEDAWSHVPERLALALEHGVSISITACCDTEEQAQAWAQRLGDTFGVTASVLGTRCGYRWEASELTAQVKRECPYCRGQKTINGLRCPGCHGLGVTSMLPKARTPGTTVIINPPATPEE
jgi:hypothetical protein